MSTPQNLSPFSKKMYDEEIRRLRSIVSAQKEDWIRELSDFLKHALFRTCKATEEHLAKHNATTYDWSAFLQARIPFAESAGNVIWDYWNKCICTFLAKAKKRHRRLREQELLGADVPAIGILSSEQTDALLCIEKLNDTRTRELQSVIEKLKSTSDPILRAELMTVKFYYEVFEPFTIAYLADFFAELDALILEQEKSASLNQMHENTCFLEAFMVK